MSRKKRFNSEWRSMDDLPERPQAVLITAEQTGRRFVIAGVYTRKGFEAASVLPASVTLIAWQPYPQPCIDAAPSSNYTGDTDTDDELNDD